MQSFVGTVLVPPVSLILIATVAGWLAWRGRRGAGLLAALAGLILLAMATPVVAGFLLASLEPGPDRRGEGPAPGAVVILGGDVSHGRSGADIGMLTLERLRRGAALHRSTGLPILVTGGPLGRGQPTIASMMAQSLRQDFGVPVRWVEARATDTRDNAVLAAELLRPEGIVSVLLVSQAWHLPRAMAAFARAGLTAYPEPVRFSSLSVPRPGDLVPRADHLVESWYALREWVGRLVYLLRDGQPPASLPA